MITTLNIRGNILKRIILEAHRKDISPSDIIVILLKKVMETIPDHARLGRLVQYQDCCLQEKWCVFHINFEEDDYEYFLDLRKILKMSVSLILANAVERYLIKTKTKIISDKNLLKNYMIIKTVINSMVRWTFIWGFPRDIERFIN